tara:strand:+ start:202 stop:3228 length:3027 start_codon:yes stop_codon:yes gene_type:complete
MAIKRTIGRKFGVRPVQMDVSSGALSLAKATQTVANTVNNVTKFIDDNQFQEAVLNAEIQGRQIGSQTITDKNGNTIPKPLDQMTLNSFTADIYNKANIRKAQQYFKKEAINSYGLALQNHAIDIASKSFLENGGKVNEQGQLIVQKAGESYIDGIKKQVAPEVFNVISPSISKIWGQASRKASAQQIKDVKATALIEAQKHINHVLNLEVDLVTNGGEDIDVEFIENEKARVFEIIENNSSSRAEAEKIKIKYNQMLQNNVSVNAVDLAYESGTSISEMIKMAIDTRKAFENDPNIDGNAVESAMRGKIAIYEAMKNDQRQEASRESKQKGYQYQINIMNGIPVTNAQVEELELADQVSFLKFRQTFQKTNDTNIKKIFNDKLALNISIVDNNLVTPVDAATLGEFDTSSKAQLQRMADIEAVNNLKKLLTHKDTSLENQRAILKVMSKVATRQLKQDNDAFAANMERMLDGSENTVMLNPNDLTKESYIRELENKGIIGVGPGFAYTRKSWIQRVNNYRTDYIKKQKEIYQISKIGINQKLGLGLNQTQKTAIEDKILTTNFMLDGQRVDYNIFSSDDTIRGESMKYYSQVVQSFGYVPRVLQTAFESIKTSGNDENFAMIKMMYSTMKSAIIKKYGQAKRKDGEVQFNLIMENSGVSVPLMESAMTYNDYKEFATAHSGESINRSLSDFFKIDGSNNEEVFDRGFQIVKNYLDSNVFTRFFKEEVGADPSEDSALLAYVAQSGASDFSEAIIRDPSIKSEMIKLVQLQITRKEVTPDREGLTAAIHQAFYKLAPHLSIHEDDTGQAYLIKGNSILREAQSTIPTGGPTLTLDTIKADMLENYNKSFGGGSQDPLVQEAIKKGDIMFIGNNDGVGDQTYRVVVPTGDGRFEVLANNYRWNYQGSQLEKDYYLAIDKIENEPIRRILNSVNFMSKNVLDQTMGAIASSRDYSKGFQKLVNAYNSMANAINRAPIQYSEILPYLQLDGSQNELDGYFDEFLALGLTTR